MNECETKMTNIAYLGPEGSFSHIAAYLHAEDLEDREGGQLKPFGSIDEVFESVEDGDCAWGLVPYENSIAGNIAETLESFDKFEQVRVVGEVYVPINHVLMAMGDVQSLENVQRIYSKYEVFGQCRRWLWENLPDAETISVSSTSQAARQAANDSNGAAIGSQLAAKFFGLEVLDYDLCDHKDNFTRFLVISKVEARVTESDEKTSIRFTTTDEPGSLLRVLKIFCDNRVNLTHIAKLPRSLKDKECVFFVDAEGAPKRGLQQGDADHRLTEALIDFQYSTIPHMVLGSYPKADDLL